MQTMDRFLIDIYIFSLVLKNSFTILMIPFIYNLFLQILLILRVKLGWLLCINYKCIFLCNTTNNSRHH